MGPTERSVAAAVHQALASDGNRVLNHPNRVLNRYDLLRVLHEHKLNEFRAARATDSYGHLRYPVFIREEHRHTGTLSPLLPDPFSVERALARLAFRGRQRGQLLIVEYCDTRGGDGLYRKYSAFRIGDQILPRHLHVSTGWVSKSDTSLVNNAILREEAQYFERNPHEEQLRPIFELAGIEYGRIDYGLANGELQVWEINTNPTLGRDPSRAPRPDWAPYRPLMEPMRQQFHAAFQSVLRGLERPAATVADVPIVIDSGVQHQMEIEQRVRRRRVQRKDFAQRLLALTAVQRMRGILDPLAAALTSHLARRRLSR
jgi:hypothetical protein